MESGNHLLSVCFLVLASCWFGRATFTSCYNVERWKILHQISYEPGTDWGVAAKPKTCSGCSCDEAMRTIDCASGTTVRVIHYQFDVITADTFNPSTTSIVIVGGDFRIEGTAFERLAELRELTIVDTTLSEFPDLSKCVNLEYLDLMGNRLRITPFNYPGFRLPKKLTKVHLMDNQLDWIPPHFMSNTQVEYVGLCGNDLSFIPTDGLVAVHNLLFLGLAENHITSISRRNIRLLAAPNLKHLNLRMNDIKTIEQRALSQLRQLRILELNNNLLWDLPPKSIDDLPALLHLNLADNQLRELGEKALSNMPRITRLYLPRQVPGLSVIRYNAFSAISNSLQELDLSENSLSHFPHAVLSQETFPNLTHIYVRYNLITNLTHYGDDAFPGQKVLYEKMLASHRPFSTISTLTHLYLRGNRIRGLNAGDLCNLVNLQLLSINYNELDEFTLNDTAFACVSSLTVLRLAGNRFRRVPAAVQLPEGVPALKTLTLSNNTISFMERGTFSNLTTLKNLHLRNNSIISIEDGTFPKFIEKIDLGANDFYFLNENPFTNLSYLTSLNLDSNGILVLPETAFDGCISLTNLSLANNKIGRLLWTHIEDCPISVRLNLANNEVSYIEEGLLADLDSASVIDLSANQITELPRDSSFVDLTFTGEASLNFGHNRITSIKTGDFENIDAESSCTIDLSHNQISMIEHDSFFSLQVTNLLLNDNPTKIIHQHAFRNVSCSGNLDFSRSQISTLQRYSFQSLQVGNLSLNDNPIDVIHPLAFSDVFCTSTFEMVRSSLRVLQSLSFNNMRCENILLGGNDITTVEVEAFHVTVSNLLDLSNNGLNFIKGKMFVSGSSAQIVDLHSNQLVSVPRDVFEGVNVQEIRLDDNRLTIVPDTSYLNLARLHLNGNLLTFIPHDAFAEQSSLQELNLANNQLFFWSTSAGLENLVTLDLSNNTIQAFGREAFLSLHSANKVLLDGNPLSCTCNTILTLSPIADIVSSAVCAKPTLTIGIQLTSSYIQRILNLRSRRANLFQCGPYDVKALSLVPGEILLNWTAPDMLHFDDSAVNATTTPVYTTLITTASPVITTYAPFTTTDSQSAEVYGDQWLYEVLCSSPSTPSVFSLTNETQIVLSSHDGVVDGAEYTCQVTLRVNGYSSAPDEFVNVFVPKPLEFSVRNETLDIVLNVIYLDFRVAVQKPSTRNTGSDHTPISRCNRDPWRRYGDHVDFNAVEKAPVYQPTYMLSPYRAWLAVSDSSSDSRHITESWFRYEPSVNSVHDGKLVLSTSNTTADQPVFRFSSESYFPLDGHGYGAQGQQDCTSQLHNFGFTSAIHACINYTGSELLVIGGGEEVWLYINKLLLIEVHGDHTGAVIPCKRIQLAAASEYGDGFIVPESGTVIDGECVVTDVLFDKIIHVNLKVGELYRMDIFHTERNPCTSAFFLQVAGVRFEADCQPIDYTFYAAEDLHVDDVIDSFAVTDAFSEESVYQVTILNVDEVNQFTLANYSDDATTATSPPSTDTPLIQTVLGLDFIACNQSSQQVLAVNEESSNSSAISNIHTDRATLRLSRPLDYEVTTLYLLKLKVVDVFNPNQEGFVVIKIYVEDVNDNCPDVSNETQSFYPLPVLREGPIGRIQVQDDDSGANSHIQLHIEEITEIPLINNTFSTVQYQLVVVDGGIPRRGVAVHINVTISQSCLYDAIGDPTPLHVYVHNTGDLYLRIPQYYLDSPDCLGPLGMQDGWITDRMLSASSTLDRIHTPGRARLHGVSDLANAIGAGWIPEPSDSTPWYQVDLTSLHVIAGVRTQGCGDQEAWIETYRLVYSNDSTDWQHVTDADGAPRLFIGNSDQISVVDVTFDEVYGQYVRMLPQSWLHRVGLRLDIIGCNILTRRQLLSECQRCLTTFYCDGSGHQLPCGRCTTPDTQCNVSTTQHSFGHAASCSQCPIGWLCKNGYATPCPKYHHGRCNENECPSACTLCDPGTVCFRGIQSICPPGFYSAGVDSEFCQICPSGTYQNQSAQQSCINCPAGYGSAHGQHVCIPCPRSSYSVGDGSVCQSCTTETFCPCLNKPDPCFSGVTCINTGYGSFTCIECPRGYGGNGITCVDIDECATANPCWDLDSCINLIGGYECGGCPPGYQGYTPHGIGIAHAERSQNQTCVDIDECASANGGCDPLSECINSLGSFRCGLCPAGYLGNGLIGCTPGDLCVTEQNACHAHADCIPTRAGTYTCRCSFGWAGNGFLCGVDTDGDGYPSSGLYCSQETCKADNCPEIPNSGQQDSDLDRLGDVCDDDDDNDGIADIQDNCPNIKNYLQEDRDGDGVGDNCDNCPDSVNRDQDDNDNDGQGDACDLDDDNDGHSDTSDNCPLTANADQSADGDGDGIGDACDSCPEHSSPDVVDTDQNGYADPCDPIGAIYNDNDGDGALDLDDNCLGVPNADQTDTDLDGIGDACDDDKDGDSISDAEDNCPMVPNPRQEDNNGNDLPDACESDQDGDGIVDSEDICPKSNRYQTTDFSVNFISVDLDPANNGGNTSKWSVTNSGREIRLLSRPNTPRMLIGQHALASLDYSGTFFVDNPEHGNGYIGFVFGYQSNRRFYLVIWRRNNMNNVNGRAGIRGLQVKKVHSSSGPSERLSDAVYHSYTTANETELIWHDPLLQGWNYNTAYRWTLQHRPDVGLIRVFIATAAGILVDSGDLYDTTYTGGRLGVFVYNQPQVIWTDLFYKCIDGVNQALEFDGLDDYVILPNIQALELTLSFTLEAWLYLPVNYSSTKLPVICTMDSRLCMYIRNGLLIGQLGDRTANSTSTLVGAAWHHIAMRFNIPTTELSVFVNGTLEHTESFVSAQSWDNDTEVLIGRDNTNFFEGILDEVRIWGLALSDHEVHEHMTLPNLNRQLHKNLLDAHYNMDSEEAGSHVLLDRGSFSHHGLIQGQASFVHSTLDQGRYQVSY